MRFVSEIGRGALAMLFASHESSYRVPSDCYMMSAHRVFGLSPGQASHDRKGPRCNESPGALRGSGSFFTTLSSSMSGERTPISMLIMDNIPISPCPHYCIRLHDRIANIFKEITAEVGAIEWRNLRLEVCRIRSRASRGRHGYVVGQDFGAPHKHLVVDVTVTSAPTNSNVLVVGISIPLHESMAMLAQHAKLDARLRTSSSLAMHSIQSVRS
jgi:hypothetical protein